MTNLIDALHIPDTQASARRAPARDPARRHQGDALSARSCGSRAAACSTPSPTFNMYVRLPHRAQGHAHVALRRAGSTRTSARLGRHASSAMLREMLELLEADRAASRCRFPFFLARRAGVGRAEPARLRGHASSARSRGGEHELHDRGGGAGQEPVPVLEGDLRLRRAQPALARDDPRRARASFVWIEELVALRRGRRRRASSTACSSAPTRSGSPSAPTRTRSSSRTWCATSPLRAERRRRASGATWSSPRTSSRSTTTPPTR